MSDTFKVKWMISDEGSFQVSRDEVEGLSGEELEEFLGQSVDDVFANSISGPFADNSREFMEWAKGKKGADDE